MDVPSCGQKASVISEIMTYSTQVFNKYASTCVQCVLTYKYAYFGGNICNPSVPHIFDLPHL